MGPSRHAIASRTRNPPFAADVTPPASDAHAAPGRVRVFGGILATDRPLPGLPAAAIGEDSPVFWSLVTCDVPHGTVGHSDGLQPVGRLTYSDGTLVTRATRESGEEISISDTGLFTLRGPRGVITHDAPVAVDRAAAALDLIGVVLPYALHLSGAWCIHASAVLTATGAIAFVAPRGTGKSTLAMACMRAGCALVADDVVVLRSAGGTVTVTPSGLPLRVHERTAQTVGAATDAADEWGKVRISGRLAAHDVALAAIYVLSPVDASAPVERAPRATRAAALALLANGKITELLGADAAGDALSRCVELAHATPVYDLAVPRDLDRLRDVTTALLGWHDAPPSATRTVA